MNRGNYSRASQAYRLCASIVLLTKISAPQGVLLASILSTQLGWTAIDPGLSMGALGGGRLMVHQDCEMFQRCNAYF
jgi:hypothetical protein